MALTGLLVVLLLGAPLLLFSVAEGGEVGVNYGRVADNLPDPSKVVKLLKDNGITMVRIYDTNEKVLTSLANTGLKVMVMLPNDKLAQAAADPAFAIQWAKDNVAAYHPATQITGVAVGNEVFDLASGLAPTLVPAMTNVQRALAQLGLADAVKVSTPVAFTAVTDSFPPSAGRFRDDLAQPVMVPLLQFLQRTGSYFSINLYPFLAELAQPDKIPHAYALGNYEPGFTDPATSLRYHSLLDAQLDATYSAMAKLGFADMKAYVSETGNPSSGGIKPGGGSLRWRGRGLAAAGGDGDAVLSVASAQAYNNYVINKVLSGKSGTPLRRHADMDVYIFALFNEDQKGSGPDDMESNFGLFYPNMTKVYQFDFHGGGATPAPTTETWCAANADIGNARLQGALDYVCGHGADCGAIQPGASCFEPDTVVAHATYAFNDYYQRNGRAAGACDFSGAATVVYQAPDTCWSWCVANPSVGDAWLQAALQYACGNGADCSAIQPGAACHQPDTTAAHASYAFNSYYQSKGRAAGACDFRGAASVTYQPQKIGNCVLPPHA